MKTVSPADFALQLARLPGEMQEVSYDAVSEAALLITRHARLNIAQATGGDSRLSHMGKSPGGAKVGASYKVQRGENPSALVTATGPLQIIERDTKPHGEVPSSVGRLQARADGVLDRSRAARYAAKERLYNALFGGEGGFSGASPLSTPYGPRYRVEHPGTKGKHPFGRAVEAEAPNTPAVFQAAVRRALANVFE